MEWNLFYKMWIDSVLVEKLNINWEDKNQEET